MESKAMESKAGEAMESVASPSSSDMNKEGLASPSPSAPPAPRRSKTCVQRKFKLSKALEDSDLGASRGKKRPSVRARKDPAKKTKREAVNQLWTRCSMNIYCHDRDELNFRQCHINLMRKTPFSPYINNVPRLAFNVGFLKEIIVAREKEDLFKLGTTKVPFTADDVALILGVPSVGRDVPISGAVHKSILHDRFSVKNEKSEADVKKKKKEKFDRESLKIMIGEIISSNEDEDIKNTVRLWIVLLLSTFLAPRTNFTCPPQLFHCLDDLDRIKEFAWATAFQRLILHKLGEAIEVAKNKIDGLMVSTDKKAVRFVFCCSAALCVWFLEHSRLQAPINKTIFPRILRWEAPKQQKVQFQCAKLNFEQIVISLIPHSDEQ